MFFQSPFSGDFLCFKDSSLFRQAERYIFQSPFSGDFLCFGYDFYERHWKPLYFQSPFSGDFLCFLDAYFMPEDPTNFQSPFSGDFLCFLNLAYIPFVAVVALSISIFRRLSLFPTILIERAYKDEEIFQSPFSGDFLCFTAKKVEPTETEKNFQSPFSGDFLCFLLHEITELAGRNSFNLHFQETFFVLLHQFVSHPFLVVSFNLHFQETFFVSHARPTFSQKRSRTFQSPFSGDFLCFPRSSHFLPETLSHLSISIFRRLSLFPRSSRTAELH